MIDNDMGQLLLQSPHSPKGIITQIPGNDSRKTLGILFSPDGNSRQQIKSLRTIAEGWKTKLTNSNTPALDIWYIFQVSI